MSDKLFVCPYCTRYFPKALESNTVVDHFCVGCRNHFRLWRGQVLRRSSESRTLKRKRAGQDGEYEREYAVEITTPHGPRAFQWVLPSRDEDVYIRSKDDVLIVQIGSSIGDQVCGAGRVWPWGVLGWKVINRRQKEALETIPVAAGVIAMVIYLWAVEFTPTALYWAVGVAVATAALTWFGTRVMPAPLHEALPFADDDADGAPSEVHGGISSGSNPRGAAFVTALSLPPVSEHPPAESGRPHPEAKRRDRD